MIKPSVGGRQLLGRLKTPPSGIRCPIDHLVRIFILPRPLEPAPIHTHISLVFKCEVAGLTSAVEVSRSLCIEFACLRSTILCGSEPLEPLQDNGRRLSVIVSVHLNVRSTNIDLSAPCLQ